MHDNECRCEAPFPRGPAARLRSSAAGAHAGRQPTQGSCLQLDPVLAPGEDQGSELPKLLHRVHCLGKYIRAHVVGACLLEVQVRSSAHCRSIARRAALKRCLRVTRSITALSITAVASSSKAVGPREPPKISRCSIRYAMIALPAHDAMINSLPAELSASFLGEKHSATTTPESGKKIEYPPMLAEDTPSGTPATPLATTPPPLDSQLMQEESEFAMNVGSPSTRTGGRKIKR